MPHLTPGTEGRVLDGRRTPGFIEKFDSDSAMFIWRITDFEDKGKYWEIPAEQISNYQLRKGSTLLHAKEVAKIEKSIQKFSKKLDIKMPTSVYKATEERIEESITKTKDWFVEKSRFLQKDKKIDFNAQTGDEDLYDDLKSYLAEKGLYGLEEKTAEQYVLNPYSGQWLKGLKIVMAQLGLIDYHGTIPRTENIFKGLGTEKLREDYIIARLAFVRRYFKRVNIFEVPLYRGMTSESKMTQTPKTLLSTTFSPNTAKAFAGMDGRTPNIKSSYWVKFTYPINHLFMTFFETKQFNERYKEQEAVILYTEKIYF